MRKREQAGRQARQNDLVPRHSWPLVINSGTEGSVYPGWELAVVCSYFIYSAPITSHLSCVSDNLAAPSSPSPSPRQPLQTPGLAPRKLRAPSAPRKVPRVCRGIKSGVNCIPVLRECQGLFTPVGSPSPFHSLLLGWFLCGGWCVCRCGAVRQRACCSWGCENRKSAEACFWTYKYSKTVPDVPFSGMVDGTLRQATVIVLSTIKWNQVFLHFFFKLLTHTFILN